MGDTDAEHVYDGDYGSLPMVLTAWIGAPADLRQEGALVNALITDVLELLRPFALAPTIYTGEPRNYRRTPKGLARLEQALLERRAQSVLISTPTWIPLLGPIPDLADAAIFMMSSEFPGTSSSIQISIRPTRRSQFPLVAVRVTDFVARWFAPLRAAAAFVSVWWYSRRPPTTGASRALGDPPSGTAFEYDGRVILTHWDEITRFGRGVFWGTSLGPDLCAQRGGPARVLAEAPVPIARPVGQGAWLQLSALPPADPVDLARLAAYLKPLLSWTSDDVRALRAASSARRRAEEAARFSDLAPDAVAATILREAEERGEGPTRGGRKPVPLRGLGAIEVDVTLNVRLASPPTPIQQALVEQVIGGWYKDGFEGAYPSGFGSGGFHALSGPSVDGAVLRWQADLGSATGPARSARSPSGWGTFPR